MTHKDIVSKNQDFDFISFEKNAIDKIKSGQSLIGKDGVLTPIIKRIIEASLEGEIEHHIDNCNDAGISNRRNGKAKKTVHTAHGPIELATPRDRDGSFEPEIVKKRQTVLNESIDDKIIALFSLGMSYQDIRKHMSEMYGTEVSQGLLTKVTDKLLPEIIEWRSRPLESIYTIVFFDAMFFKARENGKVVTKAVYNIIGINQDGHKDVLGFYIAETEGSNFWLAVMNDLKARGVTDILIACIDGLIGFPEAINASFPKTEIQQCIIHQIRNSLKYVSSKDQKPFMSELKKVYKAETKDLAEQRLLELDETWGKKYPIVLRSWQEKWDNLTEYFKYSEEIRRLIYTTNPIEGFHRQVRKYTKTKGSFTSENALVKLIYSAYQQIKVKWNQPISNWALIISQLGIYFEGRLKLEL